MRRPFVALLLGALAAAMIALGARPAARAFFTGWLGANAIPASPEKVAAIEVPQDKISAMDAALILRAVLRYEPRGVSFLVPIQLDGKESLLAAKLAEAKTPVTFTSNDRPVPLPDVKVSSSLPPPRRLAAYVPRPCKAGAFIPISSGKAAVVSRHGAHAVASNVLCFAMGSAVVSGSAPGSVQVGPRSIPVDAMGCTIINPVARNYVDTISFGQLMLQTERSESGSISTVLDSKFRGKLVAVQAAGGHGAEGAAAMLNNLTERPAPFAASIACVLLAASLPWWSAVRKTRVALAFMACCGWALIALALYQEFQMVLPLLPAVMLPAFAMIPRDSSKPAKLESPA